MPDLTSRLEQQQTALGVGQIEQPARGLARESEIIFPWQFGHQTELEAVPLFLYRPVTGTGVASLAVEQGVDVTLEINRGQPLTVGKGDRSGPDRRCSTPKGRQRQRKTPAR